MQEKIIEELRQELKEQIEENKELLKINEEHKKLNGKLRKENDGLVTVIDLVKECVENEIKLIDKDLIECELTFVEKRNFENARNKYIRVLEILERVNEE